MVTRSVGKMLRRTPASCQRPYDYNPHSFRGGMAVDMMQEGASLEQIAARGRWLSRRAVKLYASKCALGTMCPQVLLPPFSLTQINSLDSVAISRSVRR